MKPWMFFFNHLWGECIYFSKNYKPKSSFHNVRVQYEDVRDYAVKWTGVNFAFESYPIQADLHMLKV